jgi:hypothetical protein
MPIHTISIKVGALSPHCAVVQKQQWRLIVFRCEQIAERAVPEKFDRHRRKPVRRGSGVLVEHMGQAMFVVQVGAGL